MLGAAGTLGEERPLLTKLKKLLIRFSRIDRSTSNTPPLASRLELNVRSTHSVSTDYGRRVA